jgi:hypothetical protein
MDGERAEHHRNEAERDPARPDSEHERNAPEQLGQEDRIGGPSGKSVRHEEGRGSGEGKGEPLEAGMGHEDHAERDPEHQGGIAGAGCV